MIGQETASESEDVCIIGVGLPEACGRELQLAFPGSISCLPGSEIHAETRELCEGISRAVIFNYIPAMLPHMWLRTSAAFSGDAVKVIGVDPHCTDTLYDRVLEAEFSGVLSSDADAMAYRRAALSVLAGELWFPRGYLSRRTRASVSVFSAGTLSDREAEVLTLLAKGTTNQDIADSLCVSRDTVRWHLRSIYGKLGVSDRSAACRLAKNTQLDPSAMTGLLARQR